MSQSVVDQGIATLQALVAKAGTATGSDATQDGASSATT